MDGEAYSIRQLARLGGIATQTIHDWVTRGLLPRPKFAGPHTRYTDVHLQRIQAIKRFRGDGLKLADIGLRLATMGPVELQNLVQSPVAAPAPPPEPSFPAENWKRIVLCPGLELHVADTVMHKRMAQQVYDDYVARLKG